METQNPLPSEPKLFMFSWIISVCRRLFPASVREATGSILFGIAPEIPVSITSTLSQNAPRKAFIRGAVIAFFFCFVVIFIWTAQVGTLYGSDHNRLYFLEDKPNLLNYILLCPLYVGFSAALIVLSCKSWVGLKLNSDLTGEGGIRTPQLPIILALFAVIGFAAGFTCNYIAECLNPTIYAKTYWYIAGVDSQGQRLLGGLGVYYSLLTYSLFLTTFSAIVALVPLFTVAAEVGGGLRKSTTHTQVSFDALRESLADFVSAYLVAKALTAVLMINAFTWKGSEQHQSLNLIALGIVLTLVGLFFVSVPRYYIEMEWYALSVRRALVAGEPIPLESADLRTRNIRIFAHVLDTLLIGSFFFSFWFS